MSEIPLAPKSANTLMAHAEAVSEMRKLMDQIDDLFIPSLRERAKLIGIELK